MRFYTCLSLIHIFSTPSGREAAYYYPSGLNSDEEQSMAYLPATGTSPKKMCIRDSEWAAKDGETLVVVTADHETGGLKLVDGDLAEG